MATNEIKVSYEEGNGIMLQLISGGNGDKQKIEVTRTADENKEFHRIITGHDIVKDAKSSTTTVNAGKDGVLNQGISTFVGPRPPPGWVTNWKPKLNEQFQAIMELAGGVKEEVIMERKYNKMKTYPRESHHILYFNECGRSAIKGKLASDNNVVEFDTSAMGIDEGPGSGTVKFPPPGYTITFDRSFFLVHGIQDVEKWQSTSNDDGKFTYKVTLTGPADGTITDKDKLTVGNPVKNKAINDGGRPLY